MALYNGTFAQSDEAFLSNLADEVAAVGGCKAHAALTAAGTLDTVLADLADEAFTAGAKATSTLQVEIDKMKADAGSYDPYSDEFYYPSFTAQGSKGQTAREIADELMGRSSSTTYKSAAESASVFFPATPNCWHSGDIYTLNDGTTVTISSYYAQGRTRHGDLPDVGCYLDDSWIPDQFSYMIGWQDYGLPYCPLEDTIRYARAVLAHARNGEVVEIGCLGAHGRTGTFLAILEVLAAEGKMTGISAIGRVRRNHCHKAVETRKQARYVGLVARRLIRERQGFRKLLRAA